MADIRTVDGLDVRAGQLLRHSSGVVVRVTGAARKKVGRDIVNTVQVERTDNGQRGYLELRGGQQFTVATGKAASPESERLTISAVERTDDEQTRNRDKPKRPMFYARSRAAGYDDDRTAYSSKQAAERAASLVPQGYVSNRPPG